MDKNLRASLRHQILLVPIVLALNIFLDGTSFIHFLYYRSSPQNTASTRPNSSSHFRIACWHTLLHVSRLLDVHHNSHFLMVNNLDFSFSMFHDMKSMSSTYPRSWIDLKKMLFDARKSAIRTITSRQIWTILGISLNFFLRSISKTLLLKSQLYFPKKSSLVFFRPEENGQDEFFVKLHFCFLGKLRRL